MRYLRQRQSLVNAYLLNVDFYKLLVAEEVKVLADHPVTQTLVQLQKVRPHVLSFQFKASSSLPSQMTCILLWKSVSWMHWKRLKQSRKHRNQLQAAKLDQNVQTCNVMFIQWASLETNWPKTARVIIAIMSTTSPPQFHTFIRKAANSDKQRKPVLHKFAVKVDDIYSEYRLGFRRRWSHWLLQPDDQSHFQEKVWAWRSRRRT